MSTILKALENNNSHSQARMMIQPEESSWKIIAVVGLLLIALLLAVVSFLLLKPATTVLTHTNIPVTSTPVSQTTVIKTQVQAPFVYENSEEPTSRVTEVDFKTTPLPLVKKPNEETQKLVSHEKPDRLKQMSVVSDKPKVAKRVDAEPAFNDLELSGVSADLQKRFAMAVEFEEKRDTRSVEQENTPIVGASDISSMPVAFQFQVPDMRYDSHMYSTDVEDRWIRINGIDLHVGDEIGSIELLDIMPQQSLFRLNNQHFTLESLQDWKG